MITARSAGSEPAGQVHPLTIRYLQEAGISTEGLQSQSWDEFESYEPDVVITDMIMPHKSGINLISDILREYPDRNRYGFGPPSLMA